MESLSTEVVVVGAGPCGVTLANHLGLHGVQTVIVDPSPTVLDYPREVRCRYVIGADGGRSTVRRLIGVELTGETHAHKWLVVDVENDCLEAPFSGVYCDPDRPHMSIDLPYGFRRFEFMLLPQDDEDA